jgi:hypothetical protein
MGMGSLGPEAMKKKLLSINQIWWRPTWQLNISVKISSLFLASVKTQLIRFCLLKKSYILKGFSEKAYLGEGVYTIRGCLDYITPSSRVNWEWVPLEC